MIAKGVGPLPESLPTAVRAFLRDHIESYEQLEILLLLRRRPGEALTARALMDRMELPRDTVEESLDGLARAGCVTAGARSGEPVRYAPRDATLAATIDGLAAAYEDSRLAIIKLMSANAIERVRSAAIHTFADAFVIGRKKDG